MGRLLQFVVRFHRGLEDLRLDARLRRAASKAGASEGMDLSPSARNGQAAAWLRAYGRGRYPAWIFA
ncbi:MAG: hypothetical protein ACM3ZB_04740 [bacterium]